MAGQPQGSENRKSVRMRVNLSVVYRVDRPVRVRLSIGSKEIRATMVDLSEGGISFLTDAPLPQATSLRIKFTLFNLEKEDVTFYGPMEITGEVRYSMPLGDKEHRVGIQFKQIEAEDKKEILSFIKRTAVS